MTTHRIFKDQMGREVMLSFPPRRIISLVPSQTEFLATIGLEKEVAGITRFCIHPERWHTDKPKVGGTKRFSFESIKALNPDLVIGNKEENYREGIEELAQLYPVWMSDINSLDDALSMMSSLGEITDRLPQAMTIVDRITKDFQNLQARSSLTVLYLIWRNPWMAAGTGTFINDMLARNGFSNAVKSPRYPELSLEGICETNPDIVFLSSEPFPFKEKHAGELKKVVPTARIMLVDGEMFSWYGSRLLHACAYFANLQSQLRSF